MLKIQDIVFLLIFIFLTYKQDSKWLIVAGLIALLSAIPLFYFWIFFTAERLTWYAGAFFLLAIIFYLLKSDSKNR